MFEPNNNDGKTIPILEYQKGKFIYPLDKILTNEINNHIIPQVYYNNFNRLPNNPAEMSRIDIRYPYPPFNVYGYNNAVSL